LDFIDIMTDKCPVYLKEENPNWRVCEADDLSYPHEEGFGGENLEGKEA
jgi:hypothetical protein